MLLRFRLSLSYAINVFKLSGSKCTVLMCCNNYYNALTCLGFLLTLAYQCTSDMEMLTFSNDDANLWCNKIMQCVAIIYCSARACFNFGPLVSDQSTPMLTRLSVSR